MLKRRLWYSLLIMMVLASVAFLWPERHTISTSPLENKNFDNVSSKLIRSSDSEFVSGLNRSDLASSQRVTANHEFEVDRIPSKPKVLVLADSVSDDEVQNLAVVWPEIKSQRSELSKSYRFDYKDSEESVIATLEKMLEDAREGNAYALQELTSLTTSCELDGYIGVHCDHIGRWYSELESQGERFSAFEALEQLAIDGDIFAQSLYAHNMIFAVGTREVNTARDIQLWQERKQRMITYLIKFSKAGDMGAQFYLGATFEDNRLIKASPFWAAVFYKQLTTTYGQHASYDNLVELHELDEALIEKARQSFFDS